MAFVYQCALNPQSFHHKCQSVSVLYYFHKQQKLKSIISRIFIISVSDSTIDNKYLLLQNDYIHIIYRRGEGDIRTNNPNQNQLRICTNGHNGIFFRTKILSAISLLCTTSFYFQTSVIQMFYT